MKRLLRVGIDAMLADGSRGGVQQFIIGLAQGLSLLSSEDEEYIFFVYSDQQEWISPYVSGSCRIQSLGESPRVPVWKQHLRRVAALQRLYHRLRAGITEIPIARSDGQVEEYDLDLLHFTTQAGYLTAIPTIYHPWDLQHIHYPQFFNPLQIKHRHSHYKALCDQAAMVAVASTWTKHDVENHLQLPPEKVHVVPMASVVSGYLRPSAADLERVRSTYKLPSRFAFYPAHFWEHKNHARLIEALVHLRDERQVCIPVVFTGRIDNSTSSLRHLINARSMQDQVRFLGYLPPEDLSAIYALSDMLVFPSLFEGWGLPISEAMEAGVPVVCSNVNHLPRLVEGAGITFDPMNIRSIADAVSRVWMDEQLRHDMIFRGRERANQFTWHKTASMFRAHYRRLANRPLTEDDTRLLAEEPLV